MEDNLKFELPTSASSIIKVIGVGGGGSNAVNYMYTQGISGVDFIVCNTDSQALDKSPVPIKVQLGATLLDGQGAGALPEVGRNAAIESLDEIRAILEDNTTMVFITAGMGGGTGTGAAPVIAKLAKDMGILTVGIVTQPFVFEGRKRSSQADLGLREIRDNVDTLLVIENDKLRHLHGNLSVNRAFSHADEVLCTAAKGIAEVITLAGDVNVDMNDVKTVMRDSGYAIMGSGRASGEGRAMHAVNSALESPLLNNGDIMGSKFILLNITYGNDELLMDEISEITDHIQERAGHRAEVIWGYGQDLSLNDDICITVIATGFGQNTEQFQEEEDVRIELEVDKKEVQGKVTSPTQKVTEDVSASKVEETEVHQRISVKSEEVKTEDTQPTFVQEKQVETEAEQKLEPKTFELDHEERITYNAEPVNDSNRTPIETASLDTVMYDTSDSSMFVMDHLSMQEESASRDARPSREEAIQRNKEREIRMREFHVKLKTATGMNELESEPAYMRRKIAIDATTNASESSTVSRYTLSETNDENGRKRVELRENPFLHDNVD
ncbi:MAG: cell division protein FtsZ [Flavobacteriales bacterium]